ncbi:tetratricopeptide repeat protein [Streptomyces sp. SID4928]|uniref:tetratricopeptide repeat-containing glycosyltransferase family protein n=1 Tax=unclassified Streptomyces TaxID=2593676 RepID=UPI0001C1D49B|nr:tetratricopeptide repeat-containing glycosyltransferase family protein [Streptomyces sp. ACT-1]EGE42261.1 polysaccharide pyruvyl transferase [Streptomyces sp. ACT-1]MYR50308.1 tetratricopeptide repeat protein [Streptomyces sp. SID4928]
MTHPDPSTTPDPASAPGSVAASGSVATPGSAPAPGPPSSAPGSATEAADDRRAVTGKRRIAFAVYVADAGELPGLRVLLRSLALSDPALCEDVVVLHPGLPDDAFDAARRLHPRLLPRPAGGRDDVFRLDGYDTVVALTPAMVVLGRLDALLGLRTGVAAVPRPGPDGAPDPRGGLPDDGLMVIQRQDLGPVGPTAKDVPEGLLVPLDSRADFRARRLHDDLPVPEGVVVLNFAGVPAAPAGLAPARAARDRFELGDEEFRAAYLALPGAKHPDLLLHLALPYPGRPRPPIDLVRQLAEIHRGRGRHDEAVALLGEAVADRPDLPRCHETLGVCLMALSRYEEAETHLLLATASPDFAPRAFGQLARLAWLLGRTEDARGYALAGLEADPTDANCRAWYARTTQLAAASRKPVSARPDEQLAHVALFADGEENAGDKVLPEAVRACFTSDTGPEAWHQQHAHLLVDDASLERLNARRAVIVGGGGLFLPDTAPNGNSGWQWNIPDDVLARITAPLAVFAVGYNVFDGQRYRRERFAASLRALVERSAFFGLRNHGSVARVRELLPASLRERVCYQPCPTTVARHLDPRLDEPGPREDSVLINCAYDRAGLRFGHDYGHFLAEMAAAVRAVSASAEVRYAAHMPADERFVDDLRREHGLRLPVEPLYLLSNDGIRDLYRRARLVIGMRGHAGMIPFGCGTPVVSLVSHPKLAYFLADIERPDWGVSVHERDLGARLAERALAVLADHPAAVADVHDRQQRLWSVTRDNLARLRELTGLPDPFGEPGAGPVVPVPRPAAEDHVTRPRDRA